MQRQRHPSEAVVVEGREEGQEAEEVHEVEWEVVVEEWAVMEVEEEVEVAAEEDQEVEAWILNGDHGQAVCQWQDVGQEMVRPLEQDMVCYRLDYEINEEEEACTLNGDHYQVVCQEMVRQLENKRRQFWFC